MFSTIVVPLDDTSEALRALKPARAIADATGADLIAASVTVDRPDRRQFERRLREEIRTEGVSVNFVVTYVNPYSVSDGLSNLFMKSGEVLVVAASGGHPRTAGLVGSVTERLVHDWPGIPVLLVGPNVDVDAFALDGALIACVDPTSESAAVVGPVARFSKGLQLAPWVVSVVEPVGVTAGPSHGVEPVSETSHIQVIAGRIKDRGSLDANWEVLHGKHPARSIVEFAEGLDAAMIAVATRERGGLSRLALGSVAIETVAKAHCPVLTVHAGDPR